MPKVKMWGIVGELGKYLYTGTWFTRGEAITAHCQALGKDWAYCQTKGDGAVHITVTWNKPAPAKEKP